MTHNVFSTQHHETPYYLMLSPNSTPNCPQQLPQIPQTCPESCLHKVSRIKHLSGTFSIVELPKTGGQETLLAAEPLEMVLDRFPISFVGFLRGSRGGWGEGYGPGPPLELPWPGNKLKTIEYGIFTE